jgi:WD40 repeat protein
VVSCDINIHGNEIAILGANGQVSLLKLDSSSYNVMIDSHTADLSDVGYNDVTGRLLTAGKDSSIKIWEAESMTLIHEFNTSEQDPPTRVVSSNVDEMAAVGFKSGFVRIIDMKELKVIHETMTF